MGLRTLFFAEDPGAANMVAPLAERFANENATSPVAVWADGLAAARLEARGISVDRPPPPRSFESHLRAMNPSVVVVGTAENPASVSGPLVASARRLGIPTVGLVDAAMNSRFRFSGGTGDPKRFAPDWIAVPDEWTRRTYLELGFPAERVEVTGHPHFDEIVRHRAALRENRAEIRRRIFPKAERRNVVLFAAEGSLARSAPVPLPERSRWTFAGDGGLGGRTEICVEETLAAIATFAEKPYFVLRPHPKDDSADYARFAERVDEIRGDSSSVDSILAADLIVGSTSMLLTEAMLLGRPTLAVVPLPEEAEWLPGARIGRTPVAWNRERLRNELANVVARLPIGELPPPSELLGGLAKTAAFLSRVGAL